MPDPGTETPTATDGRLSLNAHVEARGHELRLKYGPQIGWEALQRILADRTLVRYPCDVVFDPAPLLPGEFAVPVPRGDRPEDGFDLHVHPFFMLEPARLPLLVLYQLVAINYGEFASADDAETFGAAALGLTKDDYYQQVCALADEISPTLNP